MAVKEIQNKFLFKNLQRLFINNTSCEKETHEMHTSDAQHKFASGKQFSHSYQKS